MRKCVSPLFTVLTPTYNRRELLHDVYSSLKAQTFKDFEWLIVDDGSTDGTDSVIENWEREALFSVRQVFQPNRGKTSALNLGVPLATGELVVLLDSDDYLEPIALEVLAERWRSDLAEYSDKLGGVFCTTRSPDGRCIGKPAPDAVVADPARQVAIRAAGDKLPVIRRDLLLAYPFPEFGSERFVPEGLIWNRLSLRFAFSYVRMPLCVGRYQASGLSGAGIRLRLSSPKATMLYYHEAADRRFGLLWAARAHVNDWRFSFHFRRSIWRRVMSPASAVFAAVGLLMYFSDKRKLKQ